jgi:hypothetical protein
MKHSPQLWPLHAMARRIHVRPKWLRDEARAGRLPCIDAGDTLLFDADAIEKILASRLRAASRKAGAK